MQIAAAGDRALLVTLAGASSADLRAAAESVRGIAGVVAAIVGHESIYVIGTGGADAVRHALAVARAADARPVAHHRIEVSFDDAHALDVREFLAHVNASREEFLARLRSIRLSVRYLGFRAGFAYCDGWPAEWSMPRRTTSRNHVPGGSFGIAGTMAGFYAVDSPGGWNILGCTAAALWDPLRDPPNLFAPGDSIDIEPIDQRLSVAAGALARRAAEGGRLHTAQEVAEVIAPGQLTTIVGAPDWSRVEHGLPPGGAFDEDAAAMANEAVGNDPVAPLLECVLVGPKLRTARPAAFCDGELNVRSFVAGEVDIGRIRGMRGYLAIEGGIGEMRLRYAETPAVLKRGDRLYGVEAAVPGRLAGGTPAATRANRLTIRVIPGPHDAPPLPEEWDVTPQLDRVGIRLRPLHAIEAKLPADLLSCGAQFGTLQWHADGSLVALGPDHPVTGGYLQPATVVSTDRWKLAQLVPGDRVRFVLA